MAQGQQDQGSLQYTVRTLVCIQYMCTVYINMYAVNLYKTQGDFAQRGHMTLDLFPAAAKRGRLMSLFHLTIPLRVCFIKEQVLRYVEWEWL